jgi:hypothetical protein
MFGGDVAKRIVFPTGFKGFQRLLDHVNDGNLTKAD